MSDIHKEIHQALDGRDDKEIAFEEIQDEGDSPLNQPVVENDNGDENPKAEKKQPDPGAQQPDQEFDRTSDDAPEQEFDKDYDQDTTTEDEAEFDIPTGHAAQAADTVLGMTDNVLEVSGGYFVKIRKHEEFYEFEEVIHVVEKQNEKNVKRVKLDPEDKALLRPLLIAITKKRAKKLTPEQLLLGAILSIIMKKGQAVMEMRAENEILEDRIRGIIREEKQYMGENDAYEQDDGHGQEQEHPEEESLEAEEVEVEAEEVVVTRHPSHTVPAGEVLEVAEDTPEK